MLRSLKELVHYKVRATDGDLGNVVDFLFDDEKWTLRYLVVETGTFFHDRKVLVSPIFFRQVDWSTRFFHLSMAMDTIKRSPSIDADKSVSRQHEQNYYAYYGYPQYWGSTGVWGMGYYPSVIATGPVPVAPAKLRDDTKDDAHLRSVEEVREYHVEGSDGSVGVVSDLLVDERTWQVRYLVVDTGRWWQDQKVLVAPSWVSRLSWAERKFFVALTREAIKSSPAWDRSSAIRRDYEANLHEHYRYRGYWNGEPPVATQPARHAETRE